MGQCILTRRGGSGGGRLPRVTNFQAKGREKSALLTWDLPENLENYGGATIVYNTTKTPINILDGTAVNVEKEASEHTVSGLAVNTAYFFRIFPFTPTGKYNEDLAGAFDDTRTATAMPAVSSFKFHKLFTGNGTFTPSKDGWYRIHAIGKSGDGGKGGGGASGTGSSQNWPSGGAGAGGNAGGYAISKLWLTVKDTIPVTVSSTSSFGSYLSATKGGDGGNGGSGGFGNTNMAQLRGVAGKPSSIVGSGVGGNEKNAAGAAGGQGYGKATSTEDAELDAANGGNSGGDRGGTSSKGNEVLNWGSGGGGGGRLYADKYTGSMGSGKGAGGHSGNVFPTSAYSPTSGTSAFRTTGSDGSPVFYGGGGGGGAGGGKDNSNSAQSSGGSGGYGSSGGVIIEMY